jgi:hypothetical protein
MGKGFKSISSFYAIRLSQVLKQSITMTTVHTGWLMMVGTDNLGCVFFVAWNA